MGAKLRQPRATSIWMPVRYITTATTASWLFYGQRPFSKSKYNEKQVKGGTKRLSSRFTGTASSRAVSAAMKNTKPKNGGGRIKKSESTYRAHPAGKQEDDPTP